VISAFVRLLRLKPEKSSMTNNALVQISGKFFVYLYLKALTISEPRPKEYLSFKITMLKLSVARVEGYFIASKPADLAQSETNLEKTYLGL
jgi:hypothetical protein